MRIDLSGKTAIVTGSSAGIGLGIAQGLTEAGASVVIVARHAEALETARERLVAAVPGSSVRSIAADLSTAEGCTRLVTAEPHCDILVNNLGLWEPKTFFDIPDEDWDRLFHIRAAAVQAGSYAS